MTPGQLRRIKKRLEEFFSDILEGMGRRERREALADYLRGLLLDGERKSMWPIAARLAEDPDKTAAVRQRIHEAISNAKWEEREMFRRSAMRISEEVIHLPDPREVIHPLDPLIHPLDPLSRLSSPQLS